MWPTISGAVLAVLLLVRPSEQTSMGPVGFTWPTPRTWSSANDNTSPCGSADDAGDRTNFPLTNGAVAYQITDESYRLNLAISYNNEVTSSADFVTLVDYSYFPDVDVGDLCYSVPDPASGVASGQNATLQLTYVSENSAGSNSTYYACADIIYVDLDDFTESITCYNYSEKTGITTSASGVAPTPAATSSTSSSGKKFSGGAIAGIVVGVVAGIVLIVGSIVFMFFHKRNKQWKTRMADIKVAELRRMDAIRTGTDQKV